MIEEKKILSGQVLDLTIDLDRLTGKFYMRADIHIEGSPGISVKEEIPNDYRFLSHKIRQFADKLEENISIAEDKWKEAGDQT